MVVNPTASAVHVTLSGTRVDASTREGGTEFDLPAMDARMYVVAQ